MSKPIYRYLADKKWRSYRRKIVLQRIEQMNVVPDYLMKVDPIYDVTFAFGRKQTVPGDKVPSKVSEVPPSLNIQPFDKGERLVTVVVVDGDVPDFANDRFTYRLHYLASNIPVSPTSTSIRLSDLSKDTQEVMPWLPPVAQKGSPYHRLAIFVLTQEGGHKLDPKAIQEAIPKDGFKLRSFLDKFGPLKTDGVTLFRSVWDEDTPGVMARAGIKGADVELKRRRVEPLPYKRKSSIRFR
jgi:large subunit ribosomal protein L35